MGDRRIDRHLGDVALEPGVVIAAAARTGGVFRQGAPLHLHLVGGLEGADDHLTDPAHGLGIAGNDAEGADVVEDVLGGDRFAADARFGKGHVLGNARIEVVAHHQHVEVLLQRVARIGAGWVGAAGQHIGLPADANDVGGVATAGPFGVEGVDGAAGDGADRVLHEAGLIEGVGVDAHLHVELIGHREAAIDRRRGGAPVLVQLEAAGTGADLFL